MVTRLLILVLLALPAGLAAAPGPITLENPRARLVVGPDARILSLTEKATGRELCAPDTKLPLASVRVAGKEHPASEAAADSPAGLTLRFAGVDTVLTYEVRPEAEWIRFRLASVAGARPERLVFLQVPAAITENVGPRLNIAWDEKSSVCLMAANRQAECGARRTKPRAAGAAEYALLSASSQDAPGPRLEGVSAALIVSPTPEIRATLRKASTAFGLLTNADKNGTPSKEGEATRGAYWFISLSQDDGPKMIDYCRRSGIRQVMLSSGAWCTSPGHYLFHEGRFPDGEAGLKRLVAQLHAAGIKVGMHTFVSKVSKRDPYVTPKPDRRFWVDRQTTLAGPISAGETEIRCAGDVREWAGSPVASQKMWEGGVRLHQDVILDDEIVQYDAIGPEGKWDTFLGCKRGAYGTKPAQHAAGAEARHYGVDGCINGYIIDQETPLIDEVTDRIAGIFNRCGFDMVYFDGGEDVDRRRFTYYVTRFQEKAVSKFRRPLVHMGTIMTHLLWHSFSRSSTVDVYLATIHGAIQAGAKIEKWPTVRQHIDHSVDYMLSIRQDLMPGELGWFGIWARGKEYDGLQLDEFEYLMGKSLAYDAPVSLETGFGQMESTPLTPQLLEIFRVYDDLRMRRAVDEGTRKLLAEKGKDFALVRSGGRPRFVAVTPVAQVGGGREVRACIGAMDGGTVATLWHSFREAEVLLEIAPDAVRVADLAGKPLRPRVEAGKALLAADSRRTTLFFAGRTPEQVEALLAGAVVRRKPAVEVRVEAEAYTRCEGSLAKGSTVGIQESEASGDVVVPTQAPNRDAPQPWFCEYTVNIPDEGRWSLWARVRYPSRTDDSFGIVLPGEKVTLSMEQVLGNCGASGGQWHWSGRGGGSTAEPPGQPITFRLKKGAFTFRIYAREGSGNPATAPRLDALCLTDNGEPPER